MKSNNITPNNSYNLDEYIVFDDLTDDVCTSDFANFGIDTFVKSSDSVEKYFDSQKNLSNFFDDDLKSCENDLYNFRKLKSIKDNLVLYEAKGYLTIKQKRVYCPICSSKEINEDGYYNKPLILDRKGRVEAKIKRYTCKHCGKDFSADLTPIIRKNANVSNKILELVRKYYSIFEGSVRKIEECLEDVNNVKISHQEVQDILVHYGLDYEPELKEYSGHYIFDSLWVKIDELGDKWVFLLVLVDAQHRSIVSYKIVEKETEKVIYDFLREATRNQPRKSITTDLKKEYRRPISKLRFKHQFCKFHTKQNINKYIINYAKKHENSKEEIKEFKEYLPEIYKIYEGKTRLEVSQTVQTLMKRSEEFPEVINEIIRKKIFPYAAYLTRYTEDSKISETSNLIERIFEDLMDKHIKTRYRTVKGFLKRLNIKISRWDSRNACF